MKRAHQARFREGGEAFDSSILHPMNISAKNLHLAHPLHTCLSACMHAYKLQACSHAYMPTYHDYMHAYLQFAGVLECIHAYPHAC